MTRYLADTSVWAWAKRSRIIEEKFRERLLRSELATTVPVALEILHSSRNGAEYEEDLAFLRSLEWLGFTAETADRALEVQRALAQTTHGAHRIAPIDYLVVSIAENSGPNVIVWHVDRDLARLCDFVDQPHEHERVTSRRRGRP